MLTGQGLIGKLALFIAERLISHKLTISIDEKKRACRAFVEFYHCLDRLEEINLRTLKVLNFGVKHGGILIGDLEVLMPSINIVSQRFIQSRGELYYALDLIAPDVAIAVTQIHDAKYSFLLMLSDSIQYKSTVVHTDSIEYLAPDSRILEIDMDSYKKWVEHFSETSTYDQHNLEWPQSLLWYGEFEQGFHPAHLLLTDKASLDQFRKVLVDHGAVLSKAREKMRMLISRKFTAEDILYVSKGMDRIEF